MAKNTLGKYSMGIGDRFGLQAKAQLAAIQKAARQGVSITPVWNKSFREHKIVRSKPFQTRDAVQSAVKDLEWRDSYFVDADHINWDTMEDFIDCSDYFTLDLVNYIGQSAPAEDIQAFVNANRKYLGTLKLGDSGRKLEITEEFLNRIAAQYLFAAQEAGRMYRHIESRKQGSDMVVEISMDETDAPQTPPELLFILAALAQESVPLHAIAPKFSGRFNKGVDYVGDVDRFRRDFEDDIHAIQFAVKEFGLPQELKMSVHTGSDKFSIYPIINRAMKATDTGVHIKTAGTTWLEELIGLAESGGEGLKMAKEIYARAFDKKDALCAPYTAIIDIRADRLPDVAMVNAWDGKQFTETLRHDRGNPRYNLNFRQLLHVGFKIAADMGEGFLDAVRKNEKVIAKNVTENLYSRHIKAVFLD
jgi:tagaturonate epimerase